jgi:hypothetical protein
MGTILPLLENHSINNNLPTKQAIPLKLFNNYILSSPRILIL